MRSPNRHSVVRSRRRAPAALLSSCLVLSGLALGAAPVAAQTVSPPNVALVANVYHPSQTSLDHLVILVDRVIDPTSIPAPADFDVTFEGMSIQATSVDFIYAGFAGPQSAFSEPGIGFLKLGIDPIPVGDLLDGWSEFEVAYTPGAAPIRDRALHPAPAATLSVDLFDATGMELIAGTIDHDYGADKLLLFVSQPLDLASVPPPADFTVTIGSDSFAPTAVNFVLTDLGVGVLELTLPQVVPAGTEGYAGVQYVRSGAPAVGRYDGAELADLEADWVYYFLPANDVSTTVGASGTVTTVGGGVSESDPVATTVTSPIGGAVSISEQPSDGEATSGYTFFGQLIEITAPAATDTTNPLVFTFDLHASLVPDGENAQSIAVLRNGVPVADCDPTASPTPVASPAPCVWDRTDHVSGDISITVATLEASRWNVAVRAPVSFDGFDQPVDNRARNGVKAGLAVPLKFRLGGDRGLDVFAAGSPSTTAITCDTGDPYDEVTQTVTAGESSLSYNASRDTYNYVWKTNRSWSGCRKLSMTFFDGTTAEVVFQFR